MELDKRIVPGKRPLNCFDTEQAKQFIGKECYFSDQLCTFNELLNAYSYVTADMLVSREKYLYVGELLTVSDSDGCCYEAGINGEAEWFQFCLPCEWVKEPKKKYRAFTLNEFLERYKIGDTVTFRLKKNEHIPEAECLVEYKRMITGYEILPEDKDIPGKGSILLGGCPPTSLARLFEFYERENEYYVPTVWQPFGIEIKENEEE